MNRNVFEWGGPAEFAAVMEENELSEGSMRKVSVYGTEILLTRPGCAPATGTFWLVSG